MGVGEEGPMCSAGHSSGADIAGRDGCCQRCCLATQYPSRQSGSLASVQRQTGLLQHGTGQGQITMWCRGIFSLLLIIILADFLGRSTYLRAPRVLHEIRAGKIPDFLNHLPLHSRE